MDAANIDLKGFTADFYHKVCGAELAAILDTLEYVHHDTRVWLEVTTLLIPGLDDSDAELEAMCTWLVEHLGPDVPLHFSAFHPDWKMRDMLICQRHRWPASDAHVRLHYGMVCVTSTQATCATSKAPAPGATRGGPLIGRDGYAIGQWILSPDGRCRECGTACAGIFTATPGDWGPHRAPVRLSA